VIADAHVDGGTHGGRLVEQTCGLLDLLDRLPARGLGVRVDDRVQPSTFAAANTSAGEGTGSVVPLPSGFTNDSEARNA